MAVRDNPATTDYICDGCGATETLISRGRPKYWVDLHILRDAYDYQGCAVADGSVKLLFCLECAEPITKAINEIADERRKARTALEGTPIR